MKTLLTLAICIVTTMATLVCFSPFNEIELHQSIQGLVFIDHTQGFIAGDDGLLKTVDGGRRWSKCNTDLYCGGMFVDVIFSGAVRGWAGVSKGTITRTDNGGMSWSDCISLYDALHLSAPSLFRLDRLSFFEMDFGLALGYIAENPNDILTGRSIIMRTPDGGVHWDESRIPSHLFPRSVVASGSKLAWIASDSGLYKTTDGGVTWRHSVANRSTLDVGFASREVGCTVGYDGLILCTEDGGLSWKPRNADIKHQYKKISFSRGNTGWIIGNGSKDILSPDWILLLTIDGGRTWKLVYRSNKRIAASYFVDSRTGWIAHAWAGHWHKKGELVLVHTSDGGTTWREIYPPNR